MRRKFAVGELMSKEEEPLSVGPKPETQGPLRQQEPLGPGVERAQLHPPPGHQSQPAGEDPASCGERFAVITDQLRSKLMRERGEMGSALDPAVETFRARRAAEAKTRYSQWVRPRHPDWDNFRIETERSRWFALTDSLAPLEQQETAWAELDELRENISALHPDLDDWHITFEAMLKLSRLVSGRGSPDAGESCS